MIALLGAGVVALLASEQGPRQRLQRAVVALPAPLLPLALPALAVTLPEVVPIALIHLKAGALLFGGGYVIIPLLQPDAVARGWLTESQFLDAIAIGQATPGPIVTTATFVGYAAGGWWGALIATVAIFAPAFVFAISLGRLLDRLSASETLARLPRRRRPPRSSARSRGPPWCCSRALDANPLSAVVLIASGVVLLRSLLPAYAWLVLCGAGGLLYHATGLPA